MKEKYFVVLLALALYAQAVSQTRYWVATSASSRKNTNSWSTVSGGAGRATDSNGAGYFNGALCTHGNYTLSFNIDVNA